MQTRAQRKAAWDAAVAARDAALATSALSMVATALSEKAPLGEIDGVNDLFTFPSPPTLVFKNGICLRLTCDYSQTDAVVLMVLAPSIGDTVTGY